MIGDKHVHIKNWCSKGIVWINDIVKNNGNIYTEKELKDTFNIKTNFLEYQSVIRPIKQYIKSKHLILNQKLQSPFIPNNIEPIIKSKKGTHDLYSILNCNSDEPTSKYRWQTLYDIDEATWFEIFLSPFKSSNSTSLRWLQIRINHNILPTKKYLYKIKATNNPNCETCNEVETITHMFWRCPETRTFLIKLQDYLLTSKIDIRFNEKSFIFIIGKATQGDLTLFLKL